LDDFNIMGIAETRDPRVVEEVFRAGAKELHPDQARASSGDDPLRAYRRILATIEARQPLGRRCAREEGAHHGEDEEEFLRRGRRNLAAP
jgi:hypothetical protein